MILSDTCLQNVQRPMQILKSLSKVSTVVVVHGERSIAISYTRVLEAKKTLLKHNGLGLELNRLQIIAKLELNAGQVINATGYLLIHSSTDLKKHVDS